MDDIQVKDDAASHIPDEAENPLVRQWYASPKLQEFGKVHRTTQGTGTMHADANSGQRGM